jgi:tripartite ATP-independent transporter DctP family solute receptor
MNAIQRLFALIVVTAFTLWTASPAAVAAATVELRAGSSTPASDALTVSLNKFAELVASKTGGEVVVRVFPQSLGVEHQLVQASQTGGVDIGMISNGNASRFTDAYLMLDLPFLFKKYDDLLDFMGSPRGLEAIARFEKDAQLKHLYVISFGSGRDIQTRSKQVKTPADISGLKIRTISTPVELATFKAWGANPTPLGWDQTYSALQQGVVDGMQSNISPVWAGKFHEVVKYKVRLNYTSSFVEVFMNPVKFASLSPKHQKALLEAASESEAWTRKYAADQLQSYLDDLRAKGMEIYTPSATEYQQWVSVREKVWDEVAKSLGGKLNLEVANKIRTSQQ